jgi:predicted phage terminase large subunit-like protein
MPDSHSKTRWHTSNGGVYVAAGLDGAFTGKGMDLGLIEDPLKIQDAEGKNAKDNCYDWYTDTFYTCGLPGFAIVLIMQRLAEDDLTGRLIEAGKNGGDEWEVLSFPAINEQGEALWPERIPIKSLIKLRHVIGSRAFNAQFQQKPDPLGGAIVHRSWFRYWVVKPEFDQVIISCDLAFKGKETSSFVCFQVWGRRGNDYYLIDRVHDHMNYPTTRREFKKLCAKWPMAYVKLIEDKANGPALEAELGNTIPGIELVPKEQDKTQCLHAATPPLEDGHVFLPDPDAVPWADEVINEIVRFPDAPNDDDVDTFAQAMNYFLKHNTDWIAAMGDDSLLGGALL